MSEILVIGTDPPCPRCALVTRRVKSVLEKMGLDIPVKHLSYEDPQALVFAQSLGKKLGTAKEVAGESSISFNWDVVTEIVTKQWIAAAESLGCALEEVPPAGRWTPELDEALRPFEEEAKRLDFLMTPVLAVNGVVMHQGNVPSLNQTGSFLRELSSQIIDENRSSRTEK
ncbi:MAG: hypothetical protein R6U89_05065 [Dehalococcoidia bacterium]